MAPSLTGAAAVATPWPPSAPLSGLGPTSGGSDPRSTPDVPCGAAKLGVLTGSGWSTPRLGRKGSARGGTTACASWTPGRTPRSVMAAAAGTMGAVDGCRGAARSAPSCGAAGGAASEAPPIGDPAGPGSGSSPGTTSDLGRSLTVGGPSSGPSTCWRRRTSDTWSGVSSSRRTKSPRWIRVARVETTLYWPDPETSTISPTERVPSTRASSPQASGSMLVSSTRTTGMLSTTSGLGISLDNASHASRRDVASATICSALTESPTSSGLPPPMPNEKSPFDQRRRSKTWR